jgi:hypothetical protein
MNEETLSGVPVIKSAEHANQRQHCRDDHQGWQECAELDDQHYEYGGERQSETDSRSWKELC